MPTISDNFTRSDQSNLGTSAEGWSWTTGDLEVGGAGRFDIVSNGAQGASGTAVIVRAEIDLGSSDNSASVDVLVLGTAGGSGAVDVCCRMSSGAAGATTFYMAQLLDNGTLQLYRNLGGTSYAQLGSNVSVSVASLPQTLKVEAIGSSIKAYWAGVLQISATDTTITTGLRAGMRQAGATSVSRRLDNFIASPAPSPGTYAKPGFRARHPSLWQGLIAAWTPALGYQGNKLIDRSGGGNHGTLSVVDASSWVKRAGYTGLFLGDTTPLRRVSVPNSAGIYGARPRSISAWVIRTAAGKHVVVSDQGNIAGSPDRERFMFYVALTSGYLNIEFYGATATTNPTVIPLNTLTHVACSSRTDTSTFQLYINGRPVAGSVSGSWQGALATTTPMYLGATHDAGAGGGFMEGILFDVRYYNRILTPQEVRLLARSPLVAYEEIRPPRIPDLKLPLGHYFVGPTAETDSAQSIAVKRPLTASLVSYWKLDEASGTRNDSHGTNHLTDNASNISGIAGKISNGADFSGSGGQSTTQFLTRASNSTLQAGNIDYTFTSWFKFDANPPGGLHRAIFSKDDANTKRDYALLWEQSTNKLVFLIGAGTSSVEACYATTFGAPTTGVWYFCVCGYNAATHKAFIQVNNGAVDETTIILTPGVTTNAFCIGAESFVNFRIPMDGLIDEVGYWKRLLTAGEKTTLYNSGAGLTYPFLIPQTISVGQAAETDEAPTITVVAGEPLPPQVIAVGMAQETDQALPIQPPISALLRNIGGGFWLPPDLLDYRPLPKQKKYKDVATPDMARAIEEGLAELPGPPKKPPGFLEEEEAFMKEMRLVMEHGLPEPAEEAERRKMTEFVNAGRNRPAPHSLSTQMRFALGKKQPN